MPVKFDLMFDAKEYRDSGESPWTFFAYPTSLADSRGLPPDADACNLLGEIQACGIEVGIWHSTMPENTTYFVCKRNGIDRLHRVLEKLETEGRFGENFCSNHSEALFARLENGTEQYNDGIGE